MAYTPVPSNPFTVPGTAAGFLDIRKRGTTGPVVTVAVPAYAGSANKLAAPVVGQPDNITSSGFRISWAAIAGADGYHVRLNGSTLFMPGNVLSYTFSGLPASTDATADVQALDSTSAKQASDYSNVVSAATLAATNPSNSVIYMGGDSRPANVRGGGDMQGAAGSDAAGARARSAQKVAANLLGITLPGDPLAYGRPGFTPGQFQADGGPQLKAAYVAGKKNIILLQIGTNGLYTNGLAQTKTELQSLFVYLLDAAGFDVELRWLPEINRKDFYRTMPDGTDFNAARLALTAFVESLVGTIAKLYVVSSLKNEPAYYAADAYLARLNDQPTGNTFTPIAGATASDNKTISYDGVHLIDQGNAGLGLIIAADLAAAYGFPSVTGTAPVFYADNNADTLEPRHILGLTNEEVSVTNNPYAPAAALYNVGAGNVAAGTYKARLIAKPGRLVSPVTNSPAFTSSFSDDFAPTYDVTLGTDRVTSTQDANQTGANYDWKAKALYRKHVDLNQGPVTFLIPAGQTGNAMITFTTNALAAGDNYFNNNFAVYYGNSSQPSGGTAKFSTLIGTGFKFQPPLDLPNVPVRVELSLVSGATQALFYNNATNQVIDTITGFAPVQQVAIVLYQNGFSMLYPTVTGAGWVGNANQLQVTSSNQRYNKRALNENGGTRYDSMPVLEIMTDAPSLTLDQYGYNRAGYALLAGNVWVAGQEVPYTTPYPDGSTKNSIGTFVDGKTGAQSYALNNLPGAGSMRKVSIYGSGQQNTASSLASINYLSLTNVSAPSGFTITPVAVPQGTQYIFVFGDSTTQAGGHNDYSYSWPRILSREQRPYSDIIVAGHSAMVGGRYIATPALQDTLLAEYKAGRAGYLNRIFWYDSMVNDAYFNAYTPAQLKGFYAGLIQKFLADPDLGSDFLVFKTAIIRTTGQGEGANDLGFTLPQYRTAMQQAVSDAASTRVLLADGPALSRTSDLIDGTHNSKNGDIYMAGTIDTFLNQSTSTFSVSASQQGVITNVVAGGNGTSKRLLIAQVSPAGSTEYSFNGGAFASTSFFDLESISPATPSINYSARRVVDPSNVVSGTITLGPFYAPGDPGGFTLLGSGTQEVTKTPFAKIYSSVAGDDTQFFVPGGKSYKVFGRKQPNIVTLDMSINGGAKTQVNVVGDTFDSNMSVMFQGVASAGGDTIQVGLTPGQPAYQVSYLLIY